MSTRSLAVAVVVALLGGCASVRRPVAPSTAAGPPIGEVEVRGDGDRAALVAGLGLVRARDHGEPFARALVEQDRARIEGSYLRRGFLSAAIEARVTVDGGRVDVTFTVVAGPRARLARVEIEGLPAGIDVDLRHRIPIADGDPFDHDRWQAARAGLAAPLADAGFPHARVDGVVLADRDHGLVVIRLTVDAGVRARFGDVTLAGVPAGLVDTVRARIAIRRGEPYTPRAIERTREALYQLGRFSLVRIELDPDETDDVAAVTITVTEAPRHDLRVGGGLGLDPSSFEAHARAEHAVAGWPWPTTTARADLRPAIAIARDGGDVEPRLEARASLDRLDLVRPRVRGTVEADYELVEIEPYTSQGPRVRLSARAPLLDDKLQLSVGWQLGLTSYTDLSSALDPALVDRLGLDDTDRIGSFDQGLIVDLRGDQRLHPRDGGYLELWLEEGTPAAGGDASFLRVMPELRGYLGAGAITVAGRARAGLLLGDAPATRRFFGGGAAGYRGLPARALSPFALTGGGDEVPYGGTSLLDLSAELRVPVTTVRGIGLGVTGFVDSGNVTDGWAELDPAHLHWATGAGLRVSTAIGVVRADLAYRLTRAGAGEPLAGDTTAYHLGLGEAF